MKDAPGSAESGHALSPWRTIEGNSRVSERSMRIHLLCLAFALLPACEKKDEKEAEPRPEVIPNPLPPTGGGDSDDRPFSYARNGKADCTPNAVPVLTAPLMDAAKIDYILALGKIVDGGVIKS